VNHRCHSYGVITTTTTTTTTTIPSLFLPFSIEQLARL
jgi:hypothetical protein